MWKGGIDRFKRQEKKAMLKFTSIKFLNKNGNPIYFYNFFQVALCEIMSNISVKQI